MNTQRTFAILLTVLTLVLGPPLFVLAAQSSESPLMGERWYRGDGLGYNVTITLAKDGTYDARWTGCLGEYGRSRGMWVDQGFEIALAAEHEDGMMQGHLRHLRKLKIRGVEMLVPPDDVAEVLKRKDDSPLHFIAFQREPDMAF